MHAYVCGCALALSSSLFLPFCCLLLSLSLPLAAALPASVRSLPCLYACVGGVDGVRFMPACLPQRSRTCARARRGVMSRRERRETSRDLNSHPIQFHAFRPPSHSCSRLGTACTQHNTILPYMHTIPSHSILMHRMSSATNGSREEATRQQCVGIDARM